MKRLTGFGCLFLCFLIVPVLLNDDLEGVCTADGKCDTNTSDGSIKYSVEDEESYRRCK